jgi:hypothetical protein
MLNSHIYKPSAMKIVPTSIQGNTPKTTEHTPRTNNISCGTSSFRQSIIYEIIIIIMSETSSDQSTNSSTVAGLERSTNSSSSTAAVVEHVEVELALANVAVVVVDALYCQ